MPLIARCVHLCAYSDSTGPHNNNNTFAHKNLDSTSWFFLTFIYLFLCRVLLAPRKFSILL